ncbi:uncharacterized protein M421DRAFT_99224 [Didymella exigua CBS 183.55]|uniref:Uncharacterized protein n=1 Tax=Didymella exigua CBS 183.55 TaxID=1150837 RepID=A0A6A5RU64_9PLEO|nr:uncharacterized protein M421DRAFT_99224 [Didymella exigua CBS 183.55]KAF1931382.1 hypothetical protein M421DRAFT_99224 [Didymella exigua CBS 183.55]
MPPLVGFSDNPFRTHEDFKLGAIALLRAIKPYQSPGGARVKLPLATGTHFDDVAAQLEGFARALWAVGTLLHSRITTEVEYNELVRPYIEGLANGTDPEHAEYWGPVVLRDQRMVEMEIISYALLAAPDAMFHSQSDTAKRNITEWLKTINGKDFPITNWLWFRVMTNLALVKVCGILYEQVGDAMKEDLDLMERFYLGQGWAADGMWNEEGKQADYYSGSFAIQFSQLMYAKMAQDLDPERCTRFRERAKEFATTFWRYFDSNGAAIPFGRSLTYRFAFAGFWSAAAFAEVELPSPLNDLGVVKGLLLRHFRWWSNKHDIFNVDGCLNIGFAYQNYYMCEDYNSPQSVYWALKSFLALGLPSNQPFWTAEEKPLPGGNALASPIDAPMHIVCNTGNHHFLLSSGQFCPWPLKATEAKYGKFAYSSHFGFSVPTGPLLQQMAPDNTIAISKDGGDTWRVPWKVKHNEQRAVALFKGRDETVESLQVLSSHWKPWRDLEVEVRTILVAPCSRWPDWYVRFTSIGNPGLSPVTLNLSQGGFAIQGRGSKKGEILPTFAESATIKATESSSFAEGILETVDGALICSDAGASGVRSVILRSLTGEQDSAENVTSSGHVLKPDANTNLMWQRTLIPTIRSKTRVLNTGDSIHLISAVLAVARTSDKIAQYDALDLQKMWEDVPVIRAGKLSAKGGGDGGEYINVQILS